MGLFNDGLPTSRLFFYIESLSFYIDWQKNFIQELTIKMNSRMELMVVLLGTVISV